MKTSRIAAVAVTVAGAVGVLASPGSAATPQPGFSLLGPVHLSATVGQYVYVQATCTGSLAVRVQVTGAPGQSEITKKGLDPVPCTGQLEITKLSLHPLDPSFKPVAPGKVTITLYSGLGERTLQGTAVAQP